MNDSLTSVKKIHSSFGLYRKQLRHIWEEYSFVEYYAPHLHSQIKSGSVSPFEFVPFLANDQDVRRMSKDKAISMIGQVLHNSIKHRVLLDAIGAFEDYLCIMVEIVYVDFPNKLKSKQGGLEQERDEKLINIIVDSLDRDEIILRIIEEKLRALFYGNPVDFFEKDKAKLEFGSHFKDKYSFLLGEYAEITARRNIIVHNSGRVDRKYLREIKSSHYNLGNKIILDKTYLKRSLCVLEGLAAEATFLIINNIYKETVQGKLSLSLQAFRSGVGRLS